MNITLLGTGGVAENLAVVLSKNHKVTVAGKSLEALQSLTGYNNLWSASVHYIPEETNILIIAVQDSNIIPALQSIDFSVLPHLHAAAHTSGSVSIDVFSTFTDKGAVFYPLQTFSKNRIIDWKNTPLLIETHSQEIETLLFEIAHQIQANPLQANSQKRRYIHLGAVFAQNFFNFLLEVSHQITQKQGLSHSIYHALLQETLSKSKLVSPISVQTGPAKRKDYNTIQSHIKILQSEFPEYEPLYRMLTDYIVEFTCNPKL